MYLLESSREKYYENLQKLQEETEIQTKAAIKIQSHFRGFLARRRYDLLKKRISLLVYRKNFKIKDNLVNLRINRILSSNEYYAIASSYYENKKTGKLFIPDKLLKSVKIISELFNYVTN